MHRPQRDGEEQHHRSTRPAEDIQRHHGSLQNSRNSSVHRYGFGTGGGADGDGDGHAGLELENAEEQERERPQNKDDGGIALEEDGEGEDRKDEDIANHASKTETERDADGKPKLRRIHQACITCSAKKQKCSGLQPCQPCINAGTPCEYKQAKKRGPPKGTKRIRKNAQALQDNDGKTSPSIDSGNQTASPDAPSLPGAEGQQAQSNHSPAGAVRGTDEFGKSTNGNAAKRRKADPANSSAPLRNAGKVGSAGRTAANGEDNESALEMEDASAARANVDVALTALGQMSDRAQLANLFSDLQQQNHQNQTRFQTQNQPGHSSFSSSTNNRHLSSPSLYQHSNHHDTPLSTVSPATTTSTLSSVRPSSIHLPSFGNAAGHPHSTGLPSNGGGPLATQRSPLNASQSVSTLSQYSQGRDQEAGSGILSRDYSGYSARPSGSGPGYIGGKGRASASIGTPFEAYEKLRPGVRSSSTLNGGAVKNEPEDDESLASHVGEHYRGATSGIPSLHARRRHSKGASDDHRRPLPAAEGDYPGSEGPLAGHLGKRARSPSATGFPCSNGNEGAEPYQGSTHHSARQSPTRSPRTGSHGNGSSLLAVAAAAAAVGNKDVQALVDHIDQFTLPPIRLPSLSGQISGTNLGLIHIPKGLFERLMSYYFAISHHSCPILYKPDVDIANIQKQLPQLLLDGMCCLAARFLENDDLAHFFPLLSGGGIERFRTAREHIEQHYYDEARRQIQEKDYRSDVTTVQALLLLAKRDNGCGRMLHCWQLVGSATRMVIDLGLHRQPTRPRRAARSPLDEAATFGEHETRRRVFWQAYIMDKHSAASLGRPVFLREEDIDVSLPFEEAADEFERWAGHYPFSRADSPPPENRAISTHNAFARLSIILQNIINSVYSVRARKNHFKISPRTGEYMCYVVLRELYGQLCAWKNGLPSHLQWLQDPKRPQPLPHHLLLHAFYNTCLLLLFRPVVPVSNQVAFPNQHQIPRPHDVCTKAADTIMTIMEVYEQSYGLHRVPSSTAVYYIFTAATIYVGNSSSSNAKISEQANAGLDKCISLLDQLSDACYGAFQHRQILLDIASLGSTKLKSRDDAENLLSSRVPDDTTPPDVQSSLPDFSPQKAPKNAAALPIQTLPTPAPAPASAGFPQSGPIQATPVQQTYNAHGNSMPVGFVPPSSQTSQPGTSLQNLHPARTAQPQPQQAPLASPWANPGAQSTQTPQPPSQPTSAMNSQDYLFFGDQNFESWFPPVASAPLQQQSQNAQHQQQPSQQYQVPKQQQQQHPATATPSAYPASFFSAQYSTSNPSFFDVGATAISAPSVSLSAPALGLNGLTDASSNPVMANQADLDFWREMPIGCVDMGDWTTFTDTYAQQLMTAMPNMGNDF